MASTPRPRGLLLRTLRFRSLRFRPLPVALLGAVLLLVLPPLPLRAEGEVGTGVEDAGKPYGRLGRAVNLARMTAESRNGGLTTYRTSACMQRADGGDCLIEDGEKGFVFRIPGGPPGWQEAGQPPSRETVLRISRDGRRVLQVLYDGSPRPWKPRAKRRSGNWS